MLAAVGDEVDSPPRVAALYRRKTEAERYQVVRAAARKRHPLPHVRNKRLPQCRGVVEERLAGRQRNYKT